jgi:hypothetical protein
MVKIKTQARSPDTNRNRENRKLQATIISLHFNKLSRKSSNNEKTRVPLQLACTLRSGNPVHFQSIKEVIQQVAAPTYLAADQSTYNGAGSLAHLIKISESNQKANS